LTQVSPFQQDPYFQLKLLDKAEKPVGEIIKTAVLTNAGGNASFNQKFTLEKRGSPGPR
jgi:hypothetical protein